MRPIKFRGKTRDGRWLHGDILHLNNSVCIAPHDGNWYDFMPPQSVLGTPSAKYEVFPETVGQFTGLLDKNGKEVYEGDFVEWCFFDCQQREHFLRGSIKWHQGGFILNITENDFENAGYYAISDLSTDTESDVEILGNVHDNPELLEGDERSL